MANNFPRFGEIAGQLVANGYRPLPIPLGKKSPGIEGWPEFVYQDTEHGYDAWGTGILCGSIVGLDIDVREPALAEQMRRHAEENLGLAPARIGQAPKVLLVYQVLGDPFTKLQTASYRLPSDQPDDDAHKVEVLAKGQQFVGWNRHQKTGKPYTWNGHGDLLDTPVARLSEVTREQLLDYIQWADGILSASGRALSAQARTVLDSKPHVPNGSQRANDVDSFRSALDAIPNDMDYDAWVQMAYAIKGALGDAGHSDWMRWSAKSSKHQDKIAEKTWRGTKDPKSGAGTIFHLAKQNGWKPPRSARPKVSQINRANPQHPAEGSVVIDAQTNLIQPGASLSVIHEALALEKKPNGEPHANIANASQVLKNHPELAGKIWFDSFRQRIFHTLKGTEKEWSDGDDLALTIWMQQQIGLHKMPVQTVAQSVIAHATNQSRNSVLEYLGGLEWDQTPRLEDWLSDYLGVEKTPYSMAIARNWLISMVARAYVPGCKVDHMPVLEGSMGKGKTSFLELLGGQWYSAATESFGSREFLQQIIGCWLMEMPDLANFNRREHGHIIATITIRTDRFRPPYGRHVVDHARTCVFAATSENDDYLSDSRGIRRFWPLRTKHIDLEAFAQARDQLFAEAVHEFHKSSPWHTVPEADTIKEQADRRDDDPWGERVLSYAQSRDEITCADVLLNALDMQLKDQSQKEKLRVAAILRDAGWLNVVSKRDGLSVRVWAKPRVR
jgi:predicted P-loop ATPase